MQFPDDIADLIIGRKLYSEKLIEIIMINGDTEEIDENLVSWFVTSASATNIDIRTEYEKPLFVSTGYEPDFLILQINLSEYTDYRGYRLPPSVMKKVLLPPMFESQEAAIAALNMSNSFSTSSKAISSGNAVFNILMQSSLSQLWGLINSLQMVVLLPLMDNVRLPANAMTFTQILIQIATFEVVPTDEINSQISYFPEEEPYSLNFSMCGYESLLFILNAGFALYIMHGYLALVVLYLLLKLADWISKKKCKCLHKSVKKLGKFLLWNSLIRLYMELYQDASLISALNMHTVDWESPF